MIPRERLPDASGRVPRPLPRAPRRPPEETAGTAVVEIAEAADLCRVQAAVRALCRDIGLSEADVFSAVISVTEFAYRVYIETSQRGSLELAAVRRQGELRLNVRAAGVEGFIPVSAGLTFPPARGPLPS